MSYAAPLKGDDLLSSIRFVYRLTSNYRAKDLCSKDFFGRYRSDIPVEHNKVGEHSGSECSFVFLCKFGKS